MKVTNLTLNIITVGEFIFQGMDTLDIPDADYLRLQTDFSMQIAAGKLKLPYSQELSIPESGVDFDPIGTAAILANAAQVAAEAAALKFYYRDTGSADFELQPYGTYPLTNDNNWHDLDLSPIVSPGTVLVFMTVIIQSSAITGGESIFIMKKGGDIWSFEKLVPQVADQAIWGSFSVSPDSNRLASYRITGDTSIFDIIIVIRGWLAP